MFRTTVAAAVVLGLAFSAAPAFADDEAAPSAAGIGTVNARVTVDRSMARPAVLPALYASYAALQVFDVYSTRQALARGAREANPLMQSVVGNQSAFWAVKLSATAGTIVAAERLWKKNKAAAITVLVVSNAVAATVALNNARVLRQQR